MCVCPDGFRKLGATDECQDIDECASDNYEYEGGEGELLLKLLASCHVFVHF